MTHGHELLVRINERFLIKLSNEHNLSNKEYYIHIVLQIRLLSVNIYNKSNKKMKKLK